MIKIVLIITLTQDNKAINLHNNLEFQDIILNIKVISCKFLYL